MRIAGDARLELAHQARLPDAGLAREQHDLPAALLRRAPPVQQQVKLSRAADQRGQARAVLRRSLRLPRAHDPVQRHWLLLAAEGVAADALADERTVHQAVGLLADDHGVGARRGLDPCRAVGDVADDQRLPAGAEAHLAGQHDAAVDADPHQQRGRAARRGRLAKAAHDLHGRADRGARILPVRRRIAEVGEHPVTQVLRDEAAGARHLPVADALERTDQIAPLFQLKPLRLLGRVDQIAEHHGDVSLLADGARLIRQGRGRPRAGVSRARGQRGAAAVAEPGLLPARFPAVATHHSPG